MAPTILVVSTSGDIHAHAVRDEVRASGMADAHVLAGDQVSGRTTLTWRNDERSATVLTSEDELIALEDVDVVWWRRINADQVAAEHAATDHQRALVNNDCRGALMGLLATSFHGEWISTPEATTRASDKIYQLAVASACGLRTPRTLVSQSRSHVLEFAQSVGRIIVKPVVGAAGPLMFTQFGDELASVPEESFATAPALYQEYVPGTRHIRLNCFGEAMYATLIETDSLDWRPDLNVPMRPWTVPEGLRSAVARTLDALGLRMGIVDLKLTPEGEAVWLEVNPQGQFLFLEPLTGEPLTRHFASFLISAAERNVRDNRAGHRSL